MSSKEDWRNSQSKDYLLDFFVSLTTLPHYTTHALAQSLAHNRDPINCAWTPWKTSQYKKLSDFFKN